jgi:head-tail adaptor
MSESLRRIEQRYRTDIKNVSNLIAKLRTLNNKAIATSDVHRRKALELEAENNARELEMRRRGIIP